jgi:hypothetical protein
VTARVARQTFTRAELELQLPITLEISAGAAAPRLTNHQGEDMLRALIYGTGQEGKAMWQCQCCGDEHSVLGSTPSHHVRVGQETIGLVCDNCKGIARTGILRLLGEWLISNPPNEGSNDGSTGSGSAAKDSGAGSD